MEDFSALINDFSTEHSAHLEGIPALGECRQAIADFVEAAKGHLDPAGRLRFRLKQAHCTFALQALDEVTRAAQASLASNCFTAAEALSRIILEQAVNFIYILNDEGVGRLRSLIKHYVEDSKRRANNWAKSSAQLADERGVDGAQKKLEYLDLIRRQNDGWYKTTPGWPEARRRFAETGYEHQYHLLFASASDSVHSLAEDIFNRITVENYPPGFKSTALSTIRAEKASFATYLVINAFLFYGHAALLFAKEIGDAQAFGRISEVVDRLGAMVNEHDDLSYEMLQSLEKATPTT
ncbi:DUF5677 domain-containing protein [Dyella jiangningensis]|uniref:DUF5677 domain-containing protein n=1 Tax=Dyella jiangningensis TaxID=1379159 RepID=UPI00240FDCA0|nr:DUF5677 domain-containing protein [Dyella jiangningensis]MDG2539839.1 DUF5677 domain-containing protein [Dyella jiangningensis]